jgi:glycine oxidase ThiO
MSSDFLIIGGGIIGLSIALELSLRGAKITVVSRDFPQAAAHAAAGMLAPQAEHLPPGAMQELCFLSRKLYKDWTAKIEHITGLPTGYWECGIVAPVYTVPKQEVSPQFLGKDWLDQSAIHQQQPGLSSEVVGGWWYPGDGQVDNRLLVQALRSAVQSLGVTLLEGEEVQELQIENKCITEVVTSDRSLVSDRYILATGAWSSELIPVPIHPKKGQMLAVQMPLANNNPLNLATSNSATCESAGYLSQVLYGEETYIVPRRDGRIIIGATSENVGFLQGNTPQGVLQLLQAAIKLYPALQDTILLEQWWGFRPATHDEMPILGSSPYNNLTLAVGHYRNGILLAPATGLLIADFLLKNQTPDYWNAFSWKR